MGASKYNLIMLVGARVVGCLVLTAQLWAVDSKQCAVCHPTEAAALRLTGMGRSFRVAESGWPAATFMHKSTASQVAIRGKQHIVMSREGFTMSHEVTYAVGSGNVGTTFLVRIGDRLFESPASYYTTRSAWGVSPGYENDTVLDFSRPVPEECLFCHAGSVRFLSGSVNRYEYPPATLDGIACERCHGRGEEHVLKPSRRNIVHPGRLQGRPRDSVCEQCHLSGEARILQPGRRWEDFVPGGVLEETWTVFVRQDQPVFRVTSHSEQLAASTCAQESGAAMWCGTCHNVHGQNKDYRAVCLSCHQLTISKDHRAKDNCVGCHMPRRAAADGGHTPFTDHGIRRVPVSATGQDRTPNVLRPWHDAPNPERNLGLAYIQIGYKRMNADLVQKGFRVLAERQAEFQDDPEVMAALGHVLHEKGRPREAAVLLARAVALDGRNVLYRLNLGLAQAAAGQTVHARETFEQLLRLDDSIVAARNALQNLRDK
ncbi:MAG TPA: multiheme c-type cytochrome [Bryobacteraceae bacterium]|nr:multiheme c-type cytochrome [Bryobacteraceae bacterium]